MMNGEKEGMSELQYTITNLLGESKLAQVHDICCDEKNQTKVCDDSMELYAQLFSYFLDNPTNEEEERMLRETLNHIARVAPYKSMLVAIWEQIEPMYDLKAFLLLVPSLTIASRNALVKGASNVKHNVASTLSNLAYYGESINKPDYSQSNPDSKPDHTHDEKKVYRFISACLELCQVIVDDLIKLGDDAISSLKKEIFDFCVELLYMLCELDLDGVLKGKVGGCCSGCSDGDSMSEKMKMERRRKALTTFYKRSQLEQEVAKLDGFASELSDEVIKLALTIHPSHQLLVNTSWTSIVTPHQQHDDDNAISSQQKRSRARGCLFYLIYVAHKQQDIFPQVLDHTYKFFNLLPSSFYMLSSEESACSYKGLKLFNAVVTPIEPLALANSDFTKILQKRYRDSQVNISLEVLDALAQLAQRSSYPFVRQNAGKMICLFMDKFKWLDRFNLTYELMLRSTNSQIIEIIINYFRDKLVQILNSKEDETSEQYFMRNPKMSELLDSIFELSEQMQDHVFDHYHRLMAALSLLRIIFMCRSSHKYETLLWKRLPTIEKQFVTPLHNLIKLTMLDLKAQLKKANSKNPQEQETHMVIGGSPLMYMQKDQRISLISSCLSKFDLMQGVCSMVMQNFDQQLTSQST